MATLAMIIVWGMTPRVPSGVEDVGGAYYGDTPSYDMGYDYRAC